MIPAPQEVVPTQSQTLQQEIIELQNNEITSSSSNFAQARPIQLPKRFQSPRGIFTNYYDLIIIAALDNAEQSQLAPQVNNRLSRLSKSVLGDNNLCHVISEYYIPESTMIDEQQKICADAIEEIDYRKFKKTLGVLKIYKGWFSSQVQDCNLIGTYNKHIGGGKHKKQYLLNLACYKHPKHGVYLHRYDNLTANKAASQIAIIKELIKTNIDLNTKNENGETAIHAIVRNLNEVKRKQEYLQQNNCIHFPFNSNFEENHYSQIIKMLVYAGANIDEKSSTEYSISPLSLALGRENLVAMNLLLDLGAGQNETFWINFSWISKDFRKELPRFIKTIVIESPNLIRVSLRPRINTLS